jgi:hypothetical protein
MSSDGSKADALRQQAKNRTSQIAPLLFIYGTIVDSQLPFSATDLQ